MTFKPPPVLPIATKDKDLIETFNITNDTIEHYFN